MTIFISDLHLGYKKCQAKRLYKFLLDHTNHDKIVLVGDVIDDHQMKLWPIEHQDVLRLLLTFNEIIYLPGNHDKRFRRIFGVFGNAYFTNKYLFRTKDKVYLVTHGDQYDWWTKYTRFLSESLIAKYSRSFFTLFHDWFLDDDSYYQHRLVRAAKEHNCDGIICGHNHLPEIKTISAIDYLNCGDWVHNCTGIVEEKGIFTLKSY